MENSPLPPPLCPPRGRVFDDITQTIGGTPLVRLGPLEEAFGCKARVLAKLEFFNPLSSVKDRTALGMLSAAESAGQITRGATLVEPTSGNTGIGLAFLAAARGYRLILTMPENMSAERRKLLAYLGAEIVLTPAEAGMVGAVEKAAEIVKDTAGAVTLGQFSNPANPAIHAASTAQEIWADTGGAVDVFVAGVGTGGTVEGTGKTLKKLRKNVEKTIEIVVVEPAESQVLAHGAEAASVHGIQGIGANFVPPLLEVGAVDAIHAVTTKNAIETAQKLAKMCGIPAGISGGGAVFVALSLACEAARARQTIVTVIPDSAERYLSTSLFD